MILPAISLCEQTISFDEEAIYGDVSIPPYDVSYSVRYGDDRPFLNRLIRKEQNFEAAFDLWDHTELNVKPLLIDISKQLIDAYPPPYDEDLSIELSLFDGHDCEIASSVYNGCVIEADDYDYCVAY